MLRAKAAAGLVRSRKAVCDDWRLGQFLDGIVPEIGAIGVLIGTAGAAQKTTIQIRDPGGRVVMYLKYGESAAARKSLADEYHILRGLPSGAGPHPVKFGRLGDGEAILTLPVEGTLAPATVPPHASIRAFLESLVVSGAPLPLNEHPWVRNFRKDGNDGNQWLDDLSSEKWPIVINHGDLAPWNVILDGQPLRARAVDWEQGCLEGFPQLDLCHYLLQTAALVCRWSPERALRYSIRYMSQKPWPGLPERQAAALLHLTALHDYRLATAIGTAASEPLQIWRQQLLQQQVRP
jgi:hypothetical protein